MIAAAGSTDILIPPSIAFVIYSLLVPQASVPALFAAGMIPGILSGLTLILVAWWLSVRHGFEAEPAEAAPAVLAKPQGSRLGAAAPVIILGGMRSGFFTPTEAAVVAVFYGFFVGMVVYRTLDLARRLRRAGRVGRDLLGDPDRRRAGQRLRLGEQHAGHFRPPGQGRARHGSVGNRHAAVSIQVLLLVAGMFLDAISIYFIFLPLLIPIAMHFNWDLVWFGVIITMNMALGQFTPPLGVNLMVTCRMAGVSMESTVPLGAVDGGGDGERRCSWSPSCRKWRSGCRATSAISRPLLKWCFRLFSKSPRDHHHHRPVQGPHLRRNPAAAGGGGHCSG